MPLPLTPQEEKQILDLLDIGASGVANPTDAYSKYIISLSDKIVKAFKKEIKDSTNGSGALAQSVVPIVKSDSLQIDADFYYKFIDDGVQGVDSSIGGYVGQAPYKFRSLKVSKDFLSKMKEYVGNDLSHQFAVAINIKRRGIKPHNITENVVPDKVLDKIAEDLATITGLTFEVIFDKHTN